MVVMDSDPAVLGRNRRHADDEPGRHRGRDHEAAAPAPRHGSRAGVELLAAADQGALQVHQHVHAEEHEPNDRRRPV
jgi:hypothetical protein